MMETNVTDLVEIDETQFVVAEATDENAAHTDALLNDAVQNILAQKENAPESTELGASTVACAIHLRTQYSTAPCACQIADEPSAGDLTAAPTLEEIESEITAAAHTRIEAALHELNAATARIERECAAREVNFRSTQDRVNHTRTALEGLAGERASLEKRAHTFLTGEELQATLEKIHLAFNVRQLELEDVLATVGADVEEMRTEIQVSAITDALEIQLAKQDLERLEAVAPEVATSVRLAASAEENLTAAMQAVRDGLLCDAAVLLEKAKAGNADPGKIADVERALTEARLEQTAQNLIARLTAHADQIGAVRRIRKLMDEAESVGVADRIAPQANRALRTARDAANARYAQARPLANHLADEGFVPVVGDGRIEVWRSLAPSSRGNGSAWVLDHLMVLHGNTWDSETPRVPITRRELPREVQRSRWFKQPSESATAAIAS